MPRASREIIHTHHFARQTHKTFIILLVPALGIDIHYPLPTSSPHLNHGRRQVAHTHSAGLSSISSNLARPIRTNIFSSHLSSTSTEEVVALRDGVSRLFLHACVLLMRRAVRRECAPSTTFFPTPCREKRDIPRAYFRSVSFLCSFI